MVRSRTFHINARNHERRFEHAQRRARELLPLCEDAVGRRLGIPLVLEASNWETLYARTMARLFSGLPFFRKIKNPVFELLNVDIQPLPDSSNYPIPPFPDPLSAFFAMSVYARLHAQKFADAFGYCDREKMLVGINTDAYRPGLPVSDYVIAHELIHLILAELGLDVPINSNLVLSEGAATFYGDQVTRVIHPDFDITRELSHFGPLYAYGYSFFRVVKEAGFEPVEAITEHSPIVQVPFDCPNCGGVHKLERLIDIGEYISLLRIFRSVSRPISEDLEVIRLGNLLFIASSSGSGQENM